MLIKELWVFTDCNSSNVRAHTILLDTSRVSRRGPSFFKYLFASINIPNARLAARALARTTIELRWQKIRVTIVCGDTTLSVYRDQWDTTTAKKIARKNLYRGRVRRVKLQKACEGGWGGGELSSFPFFRYFPFNVLDNSSRRICIVKCISVIPHRSCIHSIFKRRRRGNFSTMPHDIHPPLSVPPPDIHRDCFS